MNLTLVCSAHPAAVGSVSARVRLENQASWFESSARPADFGSMRARFAWSALAFRLIDEKELPGAHSILLLDEIWIFVYAETLELAQMLKKNRPIPGPHFRRGLQGAILNTLPGYTLDFQKLATFDQMRVRDTHTNQFSDLQFDQKLP